MLVKAASMGRFHQFQQARRPAGTNVSFTAFGLKGKGAINASAGVFILFHRFYFRKLIVNCLNLLQ